MQVIFIGSGNIAGLMGSILTDHGHTILQVYSRQEAHAKRLADKFGATPVSTTAAISKAADLYILAVSDDALPVISQNLSMGDKLVIHTSGTVSKAVLKTCSTAYGVIWPVKMVRASAVSFSPATMVIDANNAAVMEQIRKLALVFSENILVADDETRAKMHLVATFTTNFSNHLFHLASDYCRKENMPFAVFYPLIEAAVQQLQSQDPAAIQAGPAFRGDEQTLAKHRELLLTEPRMKQVYDLMTESIRLSFNNPVSGK